MNRDVHEGFVTGFHKVGPVILAPYSAAHAFALEASKWSKDQLASPAGIVRFLNVCSRPVDTNCLPAGWPLCKVPFWLSAYGVALALSIKERTRAVQLIDEYLADCLSTPRVDRPTGGNSGDGFVNDNELLTRVCMAIDFRIPEHRAWSMPLGALNTYLIHFQIARCKLNGERFNGSLADPDFDAFLAEQFEKEKTI